MGNVKELNLTKLTTNNVPRNVGEKLNRRYSKKKVKPPYQVVFRSLKVLYPHLDHIRQLH